MKITKNIMILGGYGRAGLDLARLLLRYSPHNVCLAGRDLVKASKAARALNSKYSGERVRGVEVNVAFKIQLAAALDGYDLVIDAIRKTAFGGQIVEAALDAGVDYIDFSSCTRRRPHLKKLEAEIEAAGLTFITEAGSATDAPALMARYLAGYFDAVDTVTTDCLLKGNMLSYRNRADLIAARNGGSMNFGDNSCLGRPYTIKLRRQGIPWHRRFLTGNGSVPDHRQIIGLKVKTTGMMNGRKEELKLTLKHRRPHRFVATAVIPCVAMILNGSIRKPGVHQMCHFLDPEQYMADLWNMGMTVSLQGLPDTWHERIWPVEHRTVEIQKETAGLIGQVARRAQRG